MGTIATSGVSVQVLLLAALALLTGCGGDPVQPVPTGTDPDPNATTDPGTVDNAGGLVDALPDSEGTDPDPLTGADQTQSSDVPVTSHAFLEFPENAADAAQSPALLSQTGAFVNLATLEAAPGIIPYGVQTPLWSDGAHKRRWLSLPAGGKIGFDATGQWSFPEGTVFVKDFAMALDENHPEQLRHLETRFWIAARGGEFYGAVYRWDEDQQDARLFSEGATEELQIMGTDGLARTQTYSYPSTASCRSCHSAAAGPVRGVRTVQLNGPMDQLAAPGQSDLPVNQLATFNALGLFAESIGDPSEYAHLSPIGDESAPLEERVRSYWDSNCSMCHNDSASSPSWDARYQVPLAEQKVLMATPIAGAGPDDLRLIFPGEPERSLILRRVDSALPGMRMPPMLRNRVDDAYVDVLRRWIQALPAQ
jgi:uncharacterized repeat protein (TIGR03806 family)